MRRLARIVLWTSTFSHGAIGEELNVDPHKELSEPPREQPVATALLENKPIGRSLVNTWNREPPRNFVAVRVDVGYPFLRARFTLGHGTPFGRLIGLDLNPILSFSDGGGYAGIRYETAHFQIRSGALLLYSFNRSTLPVQSHYDLRDIDTIRGDRISYLTWDSEAKLRFRVGRSRLELEAQWIYLGRVTEGRYVYLASVAAVAGPEWTIRPRITFTFPMPAIQGLSVGPSAEFVWVEARAPDVVMRAGMILDWRLYDDIDLWTEIYPVVSGPDTLGFRAGEVLQVAFRYRWATP